ncbi:MAG TPA: TonB-dependent receptor plug domain-containing protein, partial [Catalimonadaceae bacterium]|nr:TonB-dependent receptor plug domain-containing protein [Catalimonadaceae bacterium]
MKKPKQLFWLLVLLGHLFYTDLQAQERTVTGKVSDAKEGSGIPGVGVLLKGQARGTVTDAQGNFSLAVPETGAVLIFSMIGMKTQTIEVGAQTVINVAMVEDVTELKDVVVTAAGIERTTKSLGYSTQKVDGQSLVNSRETNVVQSLAGKVAGVQITSSSGVPGGSSVIKIRGNNSLSSTTDPLFVIDGIPISNDEISTAQERDANVPFTQGAGQSNRLIDINPEDIESINVLKGAAATALYGVRAGNGAIIIKTKRGGGKGKAGPTVSYSTSIQMDQ